MQQTPIPQSTSVRTPVAQTPAAPLPAPQAPVPRIPFPQVPALWNAAHGSGGSRPSRFLARRVLRLVAFVRTLALADHQPFASL